MLEQAEQRQPKPLQWHVNQLQLAGLSWGEPGQKPLLALHGWLDNAASFTFLAPLLTDHHVVALDLTGHGQSDRRSADASYQIWDDLPEVLGVVDALGWEEFDLVGHSRGAIISTLLASAFPERIRRLVLLDAVVPAAIAQSEFPAQMRRALQDKVRLLHRANRVFPSAEDAIASRQERGLSAAAARVLVERNLCECPQGLTWTTDPRLHGASAVKLSEAQLQAVLSALDMPTLLLLAHNGGRAHTLAEYAERHIPHLRLDTIEGGHHFHMEDNATEVAQRMQQFLSTAAACEPA